MVSDVNQTMVSDINQTDIDIQIDSSSAPPKKAAYAYKWGQVDDNMAFDSENLLNPFEIQKNKINAAIEGMSAAQVEVFSVVMSKMRYEERSKYHYYWCFVLLILISIVNTF